MKKAKNLQDVINLQKHFQENIQGINYSNLSLREKTDKIRNHGYFITEEVTEMLREQAYHKPWKDYSSWDDERIKLSIENTKNEFIDVFVFLMNVATFLDMDENEIIERYNKKLNLNYERQNNPELGYIL